MWAKKLPDTWRGWLRPLSGVLIAAGLVLTFFVPAAASLYLLTGAALACLAFIPPGTLKQLKLSWLGIEIELQEIRAAREEIEAILTQVRDVEDHLLQLVSEMMAERGDSPNFGTPGDVPSFAIYDLLKEVAAKTENPRTVENLQLLHQRLGKKVHLGASGAREAARRWSGRRMAQRDACR